MKYTLILGLLILLIVAGCGNATFEVDDIEISTKNVHIYEDFKIQTKLKINEKINSDDKYELRINSEDCSEINLTRLPIQLSANQKELKINRTVHLTQPGKCKIQINVIKHSQEENNEKIISKKDIEVFVDDKTIVQVDEITAPEIIDVFEPYNITAKLTFEENNDSNTIYLLGIWDNECSNPAKIIRAFTTDNKTEFEYNLNTYTKNTQACAYTVEIYNTKLKKIILSKKILVHTSGKYKEMEGLNASINHFSGWFGDTNEFSLNINLPQIDGEDIFLPNQIEIQLKDNEKILTQKIPASYKYGMAIRVNLPQEVMKSGNYWREGAYQPQKHYMKYFNNLNIDLYANNETKPAYKGIKVDTENVPKLTLE